MPLDDKILQRLRNNDTTLKSLFLYNNQISDADAKSLADALVSNTTLTSLNLSNNQISDAGAKFLANTLVNNTSLTSLDLYGNQISDAGAKVLADALVNNTSITSLSLSGNKISDAGTESIADALVLNTSLTSLGLYGNQISDAGAKSLANALANNTSLSSLNLWSNQISNAVEKQIDSLIERNQQFVTDLFAAVRQGSLIQIHFLVRDKKLSLNCKERGSTPAHVAIEQCQLEALTWLLAYGANVNVKNDQGNTLLHLAVQNKALAAKTASQKGIVELLLKYGANPQCKNNQGQVALSELDKVKLGIVNIISVQPSMSANDLQPAIKMEIPEHLLCPLTQQIMCDPVIAADGYTYEREAIQDWIAKADSKNTQTTISKLASAPADYPNLSDKPKPASPMTNLPLEHTFLVPNHSIKGLVADFLDKHPTLRESDDYYLPNKIIQDTTQALAQGDAATLKQLLQKDKRIIKRYQHNSETLLQAASHHGNLETLEVVLNAIQSNTAATIDNAQKNQYFLESITYHGVAGGRLLSNAFNWANQEFIKQAINAINTPNIKLLESCIELGAPLDYQDERGRSYLHHAVIVNQPEIVQWLIAKGANFEATDSQGNNVLHIAATNGDKGMVEKLLAYEAIQTKAVNRSSQTPAQLAYIAGYKEIGKLIEYKHRERKFAPYINPLLNRISQQEQTIQSLTKQYEALFRQVHGSQSKDITEQVQTSPRLS